MLEDLKEKVFLANLELPEQGLVKYTWGNVSQVDREKGLFVIKPSGVNYKDMKAEDMVVCDLDGNVVEGKLNPSSDTPTHAYLYRHFLNIGGICHTHSTYATAFAQAGCEVTAMGTTHADTFYGPVPCARYLTKEEVKEAYEANTGKVIVETFEDKKIDPLAVPGILLHGHGPFTWGKDATSAVMNAAILDEVCHTNTLAKLINPKATDIPQFVLDKHYLRKHGENAYYGQK